VDVSETDMMATYRHRRPDDQQLSLGTLFAIDQHRNYQLDNKEKLALNLYRPWLFNAALTPLTCIGVGIVDFVILTQESYDICYKINITLHEVADSLLGETIILLRKEYRPSCIPQIVVGFRAAGNTVLHC
jgi:hypothetical protein